MKARIGDVVIDKTYSGGGRLALVVGEGIYQPILLNHTNGVTMNKLGDYFSTWDGLEVIGHIDFEALWREVEAIKVEHDYWREHEGTNDTGRMEGAEHDGSNL